MAKKNKKIEESPKQKISQSITNLCTVIGDKGFLIRETKSEIIRLYAEIDTLRKQLQDLVAQEGKDGSQVSK